MSKPPVQHINRDEVVSSAAFRSYVERQSTDAQRRRDDKMAEIEAKREAIARSLTDHETFAASTNLEIAALFDEVADCDQIMEAAGRALRPAPMLTPHTEVTDELEAKK